MTALRRTAALVVATALVLAGCNGGDGGPAPDDGAAVVRAFEDYRAALIEQDGARAASLAAEDTLDYYAEMKELALTASRSELKDRRIVDQLTVLMLRHMLAPDELEAMDGRDVFVFSVEEGLTSETSVQRLEVGEAKVSGDRAVLGVEVDGREAPFTFVFEREGDRWKIELRELMKVADSAFQTFVNQSGVPQDEYLLQTLTSMTGTTPSRDVWDPPGG